jgi:hypothetical protein
VYYHDPDQKYPGMKEKPGYCLGVADHVGDRLCFHILTTDTHRIIKRSVVRISERSPTNVTLTFPIDEMHPNPIETNDNDDVITVVDDEEPDERGEHNERGVSNKTNDTVTDNHSATTDVQHNRLNDPHRTNPPPPAYTLRSHRRRQGFPHQRPHCGYSVRNEPMVPNTALIQTCVTHLVPECFKIGHPP